LPSCSCGLDRALSQEFKQTIVRVVGKDTKSLQRLPEEQFSAKFVEEKLLLLPGLCRGFFG
jgi:hypothetical protein